MKNYIKYSGIVLGTALLVGLTSGPSIAIPYSTSGSAAVANLGNTYDPPSGYDILTLNALVSGDLTAPGEYLLNTVKFEVGYNAYAPGNASGTISEQLTIGAVTQTISIPWSIHIDYNVDTITLGAASFSIAGWIVTLAEQVFGPQGLGAVTYDLKADFDQRPGGSTATPLPGAILLFGTALIGAGLLGRRRRRTAKAV